jgi:bifunctional non-homologous end joining protein LigD
VILDGEIAALDEKGRSSFQLLQVFRSSGAVPLVYYVFDLLSLEGKDIRKEPLTHRTGESDKWREQIPDYPVEGSTRAFASYSRYRSEEVTWV